MEQVELKTLPREKTGKEAAKKYRDEGLVPVILYGKDKGNVSLLVKENELLKCLNTESGAHVIFSLTIDSKKDTAIIHAMDRHPVSRKVRHVDFVHIDMNREIETEIDLRLVGVAPGVKQGGEMLQFLKKVTIKCLPVYIPKHLDVDISNLNLGERLHVGDIKVENIEIVYPKADKVIAAIEKPKGMAEAEEAPAATAAAATPAASEKKPAEKK